MRLRICPKCNSADVVQDAFLFFLTGTFICRKCHFRSSLFPEIDVNRKRRSLRKRRSA